MTLDWDGRIRMDSFVSYAMQHLIHLKDKFDVAFACDYRFRPARSGYAQFRIAAS